MSRSKNRKIADLISGGTFDDGVVAASEVTGLHTVASTGNYNELENRITDNNQLANSSGFITVSEVPVVDATAIIAGDTSVTVVDNGTDGKVVVRVDNADVAEFNDTHMVIPKGTTAERDANAVLGTLRYNTTTGFFETFTGSGWGAIATPPTISSVTPSSFNGAVGSTFTIDGGFMDVATTAVFVGSDGTEYATGTVTHVTNSQITITNATSLPAANEPFQVKVTNGAGLSAVSTTAIDAGSVPAFTTAAGSLAATARWDEAVSTTVLASDADGSITGYAVTQGALPAGITLNSTTGAINGTSTEQATTTYTFTIQATDNTGNTNTRQFSIQIVNAAPVWSSPAEGSTTVIDHDAAGSITLDATDPEGEAVSYTSGTLPAGLSLSGNVISGTPTVEANNSVAVTASDGFASSVCNFFINVVIPPSPVSSLFDTYGSTTTVTAGSFVLDARTLRGTTGSITVEAYGGKGGKGTVSGAPDGANGWRLEGVVPSSALVGKILCFVGAGDGMSSPRASRDSGAGGGFSGIIELDPSDYNNLLTLGHIFTAGGGGGGGTTSAGQVNSSLLYSGNMLAGLGGSHKSDGGSTGTYPTLIWAGRNGNFYGGGDSASDENGTDNFQGGSGGGCGPLVGGDPSNTSGSGVLGGNAAATMHTFGGVFGGYGGGGAGSQGGNGGNAWRVSASGGGGGGFIAGNGGGYIGDNISRGGYGGCAYSGSSTWVSSSSATGSTNGRLTLTFNP